MSICRKEEGRMKKSFRNRRMRMPAVLLMAAALVLTAVTVPQTAFADGAQDIVQPSSEGVTNPAASIELVDPAADANFYVYTYNGTAELVFPTRNPYYKDEHTVTVRLTGEDPTKPCDDNIAFFSGNECDVKTRYQEQEGSYGDLRKCTVYSASFGGPAPYTVIASSGATATFKVTNELIPHEISFKSGFMQLDVGKKGSVQPTRDYGGTYASEDTSVATVNALGIVTGVADGKTNVTFTTDIYGQKLTAVCEVTVGTGGKQEEVTPEPQAEQKANPMKLSAAAKTLKFAKVKKAKQTVSAIRVKKAAGKVAYKKTSGKFTVNKKTGKITVPKGTKKGTYKIKVRVTAAGNEAYKAGSKTVTVSIKIK